MWALPGGFVDEQEPLEAAARRELQEETGLDPSAFPFTQVGAFAEPYRDPRGWTVSAVYAALLPEPGVVQGMDDAADARWFDVRRLPDLAFDHQLVVRTSLLHVANQVAYAADDATRAHLEEGARALDKPWSPPKE